MRIDTYRDQAPIALKLANLEIKEDRHRGYYGNFKFDSDEIVVTRFQSYGSEGINITYYSPKSNNVVSSIVPANFECTLLRGNDKDALTKKFHDYVIKNMSRALPYMQLQVGSDPEIFAQDANGIVVPAFHFLGSKAKPDLAGEPGHVNKLYWDGFQAEFDTKAFDCLGWHVDSVRFGLYGVYKKLKKYDPTAKLSHITTMDIPAHSLETSDDEHVQFGCMPSMNAYKMQGLKDDGRNVKYRSAGGHIHFGISGQAKLTEAVADRLVKALDAILGVACVSLFEGYDDPRRRAMYGLAGEYRLPAHGLEYRTLSNAWLMHPLLMNIVFDLSRAALRFGQGDLLHMWNCDQADTIRIINTCNVEDARKVLSQNKTLFIQLLAAGYRTTDTNDNKVQAAFKLFTEGVDKHFEDPTNLEKNWDLGGVWKTHSDGKEKNALHAASAIVVAKRKVA